MTVQTQDLTKTQRIADLKAFCQSSIVDHLFDTEVMRNVAILHFHKWHGLDRELVVRAVSAAVRLSLHKGGEVARDVS